MKNKPVLPFLKRSTWRRGNKDNCSSSKAWLSIQEIRNRPIFQSNVAAIICLKTFYKPIFAEHKWKSSAIRICTRWQKQHSHRALSGKIMDFYGVYLRWYWDVFIWQSSESVRFRSFFLAVAGRWDNSGRMDLTPSTNFEMSF